MKTETEIFRTTLLRESARLGIELSPNKLDALCLHYVLLRKWSARVRLTGTVQPARAATELFADSLIAWRFAKALTDEHADEKSIRLIDIGSGAGLPAIPLRIMQEGWKVTALDSSAKKIAFIKTVVRELGLHHIDTILGRAEELAQKKEHRERYHLAFCRGVAAPHMACELAAPFLKIGGSFINQTTVRYTDERGRTAFDAARAKAETIGLKVGTTISYSLSSVSGERLLIQVEKQISAPPVLPRTHRKIGRIKHK